MRFIIANSTIARFGTSARGLFAGLVVLAAATGAHAQEVNFQNYNAIIFNDFYTTSDVEGRTFVGNNFTASNSSNLGNHLRNNIPANDRTFVVGNNLFGGNPINLQRGSLYIDGSTNGRHINFNGGGSVVTDHSIDASLVSIQSYATFQSSALRSMASDSVVSLPTNQPGPTNFYATGGSDGVAVFNVTGSSIFSNPNGQQFELFVDSMTQNVVINVSGTHVDWTNGNMVGLFNDNYWQAHTIWNFYEAETINLGSRQFNGAILAPNASITTSGNIDGLVVAKNLTTSAEVHLPDSNSPNQYAYEGYAAPIPEPGSAVFILSAAGLMFIVRNRKLRV